MTLSSKNPISLSFAAMRQDPLNYLAGDINSEIFSQLSARDLAECMLVNKDWSNRVAHLSAQPWKTLNLVYDGTRPISKQPPPFSEDIENVNFMNYDHGILNVFKVIASWNCRNIKRLSFYGCTLIDGRLFAKALGKVAPQVRVLVFDKHYLDIDLLSILKACPQLQSLHFRPEIAELYQKMELGTDIQETLPAHTKFENLTCLSIDSIVDIPVIRKVLKRCPNLRCIRLGNCEIDEDIEYFENEGRDMFNATDLEMIVEHCPGIEYIECNRMDNPEGVEEDGKPFHTRVSDIPWWQDYKERDKALPSRGLRVLKFFGIHTGQFGDIDYDYGQVLRLLERNQETLEVLHLAQYDSVDGLHTLHMPNLRELVFRDGIYLDNPDQISEFIEHCPSLESLGINATVIAYFLPVLSGILASLKSLKTLSFHIPDKARYDVIDDIAGFNLQTESITKIGTLLMSMSVTGSHVENLSFGNEGGDGFPVCAHILNSIAAIHSLRSVEIHNDKLISENLNDPADGYSDLDTVRAADVSSFVKAIQHSNIERIWFSKVNLSDHTFQHLGNMRLLQELRITNCNTITRTKLELLLDHKHFEGPFKRLIVDGNLQCWTNKTECFELLSRSPYGFTKQTKENDQLHLKFAR